MSVSSARPEALRQYSHVMLRAAGDADEALRSAQAALTAYEARCPDGGPVDPQLVSSGSAVDDARRLAHLTAEVADAFYAADHQPPGGLATTTDHTMAEIVLADFPHLASPTILGPVEEPLAQTVAGELAARAGDMAPDLRTVRDLVPQALLEDPAFASMVLTRLGPKNLTALAQDAAQYREWGHPGEDLSWLANLFITALPRSRSSAWLDEMVDEPRERNAIRILRASTDARLDQASTTFLAERTSLRHSATEDGDVAYLYGPDHMNRGDDAILIPAAQVPGFARAWSLRGNDPNQAEARAAHLVTSLGGGSGIGVAVFLAAAMTQQRDARGPDGDHAPDQAIAAGIVRGVAGLGRRPGDRHHVGPELAAVTERAITENWTSLIDATDGPSPQAAGRATADLTTALQYVAEWSGPTAELAAALEVAKVQGYETSLASGDDLSMTQVAKFQGLALAAADRADVPYRPWDSVVDLAAVGLKVGSKQAGPIAVVLASVAVDPAKEAVKDFLAGPKGTAAELIDRVVGNDRDLVLALVDHPPAGAKVRWSSNTLADREAMAALGTDLADQRRLNDWSEHQAPEIRQAFKVLRHDYAATVDAARATERTRDH